MKAKTFQEKWAFLTKYENKPVLTKKNIKRICALANDKDALIRGRCAKLLVNTSASKAKHVLLTLADDKDALVRTEAYDSLSGFPSKHVQKVLKQAIVHEPNALARSYAILSWADITQALGVHKKQKKFLKQLKKLPKIKKSEHYMLSFYYARYVLGNKKSLKKLLAFLNSSDYQICCCAVNLLWDIVSPENRQSIKQALEQLLQQEVCASVSENVTELLQYIKTA